VDYRADFLTSESPDGFRKMLNAFVAPVARHADAVAEDLQVMKVADAVFRAFGDHGGTGGMTRAELASACSGVASDAVFSTRFDLFVRMGLLRRRVDKAYQQRYVLNPASVTALLVYRRLGEAGGVEEIMLLLDRTRRELAAGELDQETLTERLDEVRRDLSYFADHLLSLVEDHPWEELIAERTQHRSADRLLEEAKGVVDAVTAQYPDLSAQGKRLVDAALGYQGAVIKFSDRLLDHATATRDFSMLAPEQYKSAATRSTLTELAVSLARTVFDPPSAVISPEQVISIVEKYRPAPPRRRSPRPPDTSSERDPIEEARRRKADERDLREARMELHLQGAGEVDLTSRIRGAGWRGAAEIVVSALIASADPNIPVNADLSEALIVDSAGPVSHVTPMTLRRVGRAGGLGTGAMPPKAARA
jgi:hypothetical protein